MDRLFTKVRTKVSADKHRYQQDGYDLDLTYIAPRLVGMSFPSTGVEQIYRNDIDEVAKMLRATHPDRFMVYNLCIERSYDYEKFQNRVVHTWCGWLDHHAPPLRLLFKLCQSIHLWLLQDPRTIAIVHCLAGKGRTGTLIACSLVYGGLFDEADDALLCFAAKRSATSWGVTNPSQRRCVHNFADIVRGRWVPNLGPLLLRSITLSSVPNFDNRGCVPYVEVHSVSRGVLLYCSLHRGTDCTRKVDPPPAYTSDHALIEFPVGRLVRSDLLIVFKHLTPIYRADPVVSMFRIQLHAGMIVPGDAPPSSRHSHTFLKGDLDDAYKDRRFRDDFSVRLDVEVPPADVVARVLQEEDAVVQEERALFQYTPPGALDGSLFFMPGSDEAVAAEMASLRNIAAARTQEKSGYLIKQGHLRKNWKTRWFVLQNESLSYFKKPRETRPCGTIPLASVQSVACVADQRGENVTCNVRLPARHAAAVRCIVHVGRHTWLGCADGTIHIWHTLDEHFVHSVQGHERGRAVHAMAVEDDYVYSMGEDGRVVVWNARFEQVMQLKSPQPNRGCSMLLVPPHPGSSERWIVTVSNTGKVCVWEREQWRYLGGFTLEHEVAAMCQVGAFTWVALDRYLYVFETAHFQAIASEGGVCWRAHEDVVSGIVSVPCNEEVWSISHDCLVHVWSAKSPKTKVRTLRGHRSSITAIAVVDDHVWTASLDGTLILWNPRTYKIVQETRSAYSDTILSICHVGDGTVWTSLTDRSVSVWRYRSDRANLFVVHTDASPYLISAPSTEERRDWMEVLQMLRLQRNFVNYSDVRHMVVTMQTAEVPPHLHGKTAFFTLWTSRRQRFHSRAGVLGSATGWSEERPFPFVLLGGDVLRIQMQLASDHRKTSVHARGRLNVMDLPVDPDEAVAVELVPPYLVGGGEEASAAEETKEGRATGAAAGDRLGGGRLIITVRVMDPPGGGRPLSLPV